MTRIVFLFCLAFAFLIAGCAHKVEEKDLVGNWTVDPAAPETNKFVAKVGKLTFTINPDHQFSIKPPQDVTVKGTWAFSEMKLTITPVTLSAPNPIDPSKSIDMPITTAIQMLQQMTKDKEMLEALRDFEAPTTFEVSSDGKKLLQGNSPSFVKSE